MQLSDLGYIPLTISDSEVQRMVDHRAARTLALHCDRHQCTLPQVPCTHRNHRRDMDCLRHQMEMLAFCGPA